MTTVRVVQINENEYELRTGLGFPVGERMISVAPEPGKEWPHAPPLGRMWGLRINAERAALQWNLYLNWAKTTKKRRRK